MVISWCEIRFKGKCCLRACFHGDWNDPVEGERSALKERMENWSGDLEKGQVWGDFLFPGSKGGEGECLDTPAFHFWFTTWTTRPCCPCERLDETT